MKAEKILTPVDFSEDSEAALEFAASLARDTGAELLIVHVQPAPSTSAGGALGGAPINPDTERLAKMLEQLRPADPQVPYAHRLVTGEAASKIVELAREDAADFIVLGTHGRGRLARMLLGGTAESVVRHAPCPVITLKQPKKPRA